MRITGLAAMGAGMLALTSCGGESTGANGNAASANVQLEAGAWEVTEHTLDMSAPGMPEGADEMMKPGPVTVATCITAEQAQKPGPDVFLGEMDAGCRQQGFKAAGGEVSGTLTCGADGAGKVVTKLDGSFDASGFDVHTQATEDQQGTPMTIKRRFSGRRLGDCPSGAKEG